MVDNSPAKKTLHWAGPGRPTATRTRLDVGRAVLSPHWTLFPANPDERGPHPHVDHEDVALPHRVRFRPISVLPQRPLRL